MRPPSSWPCNIIVSTDLALPQTVFLLTFLQLSGYQFSRSSPNVCLHCSSLQPELITLPRAVFSNALLAALNARLVSHEGESEHTSSTFLDIMPNKYKSSPTASRDRKPREVRHRHIIWDFPVPDHIISRAWLPHIQISPLKCRVRQR
jgi:hypothetical protein